MSIYASPLPIVAPHRPKNSNISKSRVQNLIYLIYKSNNRIFAFFKLHFGQSNLHFIINFTLDFLVFLLVHIFPPCEVCCVSAIQQQHSIHHHLRTTSLKILFGLKKRFDFVQKSHNNTKFLSIEDILLCETHIQNFLLLFIFCVIF